MIEKDKRELIFFRKTNPMEIFRKTLTRSSNT